MKIDNTFFTPCPLWRAEQGSRISRKEALFSLRRKRKKGRIFSSHLLTFSEAKGNREQRERYGFLRVERRKGGILAKPNQSSILRRWGSLLKGRNRLSPTLSDRGACLWLTKSSLRVGGVFVSSIPQNREGAESEEEYTLPTERDTNEISPSPSSPARTIVITSGKGGVGKTTATANLGMSMARLGYRVALIDADIGLRNLDLLLGLENRILYTAIDILDGQCRLDQALIRDKRLKNLSLLSISKSRQRYNVTRKNMENLVESIGRLGYHFILIDCPAGIDVGFINAISSAKEALIITTPEITAIRDADRVAGLLEANNVYDVKLLVNRVRPDMIQQNNMMSVQDVQEMLAIPLLGAIPEDKNVIISTNRGEPLVLKKKLTLSAIAFENAARRLIGRQDYFIDLITPQKGIVQRIQDIISRS